VTAVASVFDALGDPHRLRILTRLCGTGPASTLQVAHELPLSRQAATKHLHVLEAAGLISSRKHGRERVWTVQQQQLAAAADHLTMLSRRWDRALDRLRAFVEAER
jgi:DNA-binding transcriptional ArsR family regulator